MSTKPEPRPKTTPEIEPPAGTPPKRFPANLEPLAARQEQKAEDEKKSASSQAEQSGKPSTRLGSGEDPSVESGLDQNDPEQPASADDDVEKSFE